jgi:hypothetical protein
MANEDNQNQSQNEGNSNTSQNNPLPPTTGRIDEHRGGGQNYEKKIIETENR